ncbi:BPL-N domain-containing protein [Cupriavidus necator]|uniref:BPL-N domain-containing protein n=1 Tax=Cupriavidus necator TaxID=106590 RepID=UPI003ED17389
MPKNQILTYVDAGASDWTACLMRTIGHQLNVGAYEIRAVIADDIRYDKGLFDEAALFVMPGGADLPYCALLNGQPNARIRRFVEEGGVYLGICAGAYYACREIAFHEGTRGAICDSRELVFVGAVAVGSLPELTGGKLYDGTPRTATAVRLNTTTKLTDKAMTLCSHYHGGCRFDFGNSIPAGTEVLATYADIEDAAPAIVSARVGEGRAVLSGVHLEISETELADALNGHTDGSEYLHLCKRLEAVNETRLAVFRNLLSHAGLALN